MSRGVYDLTLRVEGEDRTRQEKIYLRRAQKMPLFGETPLKRKI